MEATPAASGQLSLGISSPHLRFPVSAPCTAGLWCEVQSEAGQEKSSFAGPVPC